MAFRASQESKPAEKKRSTYTGIKGPSWKKLLRLRPHKHGGPSCVKKVVIFRDVRAEKQEYKRMKGTTRGIAARAYQSGLAREPT